MACIPVTFDATQETVDALDTIATWLNVNREQILREAIDSYIAWDQDFRASVEKGMRDFEEGRS